MQRIDHRVLSLVLAENTYPLGRRGADRMQHTGDEYILALMSVIRIAIMVIIVRSKTEHHCPAARELLRQLIVP